MNRQVVCHGQYVRDDGQVWHAVSYGGVAACPETTDERVAAETARAWYHNSTADALVHWDFETKTEHLLDSRRVMELVVLPGVDWPMWYPKH